MGTASCRDSMHAPSLEIVRHCNSLPVTPGHLEAMRNCDHWATISNSYCNAESLQHNPTYVHSMNTYYNTHCNVRCNIILHTYEHLLQYPLQCLLQHNTTYIRIPIATPIAMFVANIIPHTYEHLLQYLLQCLLQRLYFVDSIMGQGVQLGRLCITRKVT